MRAAPRVVSEEEETPKCAMSRPLWAVCSPGEGGVWRGKEEDVCL